MKDWLDSEEFYELMQTYRWSDRAHGMPSDTVAAFEAVKASILEKHEEAADLLVDAYLDSSGPR